MEDFNVPKWMDQMFLTDLLKDGKDKDSNIDIVNFSVQPAVAPGNNYLSYMYKVRVEYKAEHLDSSKTASLMIKVPFVDGFMKVMTEEHDFYHKEPKIYNELLPILNETASCEFGPRAFNCSVKNVLVMDDLKAAGYHMIDKTKQLDFTHSEAVMRKLARFHAATVVALHDNKELVREVGVDIFVSEGNSIHAMMKQSLKNLLNKLNADERHSRFAEFVQDRFDQIYPTCLKVTKPKANGGFNVLNHGDMWTNNLLFKYNKSGEIVDVKFIDYQLSKLGSPAIDLLYFIWISTNEEVRGKRQKELYDIYLTTLNKALADLGCDERLSEQELREDISRSVDYLITTLSFYTPFFMAKPEDVPDLANLTEEEYATEKFHKIFKCEAFNKFLPKCVDQMTDFFLDGKGMPGKND